MKKTIMFIGTLLLLFVACTGNSGNNTNVDVTTLALDSISDSVSIEVGDASIFTDAKIVYPTECENITNDLKSLIINLIEEDDVDGDVDTVSLAKSDMPTLVKSLLKSKAEWLKDDMIEGSDSPLLYTLEINVMEETDKYITMSIYDELCFSGPHPVYTSYGITYLKPDGKKVDLSDFNSDKKDELNKEVENATRSFLQDLLKDDENFDVEELLDLDEDGIDMPEYGFFIKNDSVIFSYQIDELTPYALGMPDVNIPLKELKEKGLLGKTLSDIVK